MCGGGGSSGEDPVKYQRQQEQERQQRIAQGKGQLEKLFAGLEGYGYRSKEQQYQVDPRELFKQIQVQEQVPARPNHSGTAMSGGSGGVGSGAGREGGPSMVPPVAPHGKPSYSGESQYGGDGAGGTDSRRVPLHNKPSSSGSSLRGGDGEGTTINYPALSSQTGTQNNGGAAQTTRNATYFVDPATGKRYAAGDLPDSVTRSRMVDERYRAGDPIWKQQQQAYMDYAKPQLEQQFGDAQEQLTYALSRQGQTRGSLSGERRADLGRDYDLRRQEVADKGRGVANQARSDIASQKQSLLQMLSASADPGATATAARSAVSSLQNTPEFSPLGPLFQNATAGLAQGMQGYQNGKLQEQVQGIQYGRDPDRGSGRVIR